jgi:hypothetical protein
MSPVARCLTGSSTYPMQIASFSFSYSTQTIWSASFGSNPISTPKHTSALMRGIYVGSASRPKRYPPFQIVRMRMTIK